jgi:hypothetical protein
VCVCVCGGWLDIYSLILLLSYSLILLLSYSLTLLFLNFLILLLSYLHSCYGGGLEGPEQIPLIERVIWLYGYIDRCAGYIDGVR